MPSTRDLRRRIKSVKSTAQITKAMQMVAAAKMRKAQQSALAGRPYAHLMDEVLTEVAMSSGDFSHPLMEERSTGKRVILVVSPDKGLCGALTTNLLREAAKLDAKTTGFVTAGRKASQYIARTRRELIAEFSYRDSPLYREARAISIFLQDLFLEGKIQSVDILYISFISTLNQQPLLRPLLPVGHPEQELAKRQPKPDAPARSRAGLEFQFEPSAATVLGHLMPHYLNFEVYQVLLEAKASEHSARMVAMKNATDNANQLIKDLTLDFNKMRQTMITNELLEISTAAMAT